MKLILTVLVALAGFAFAPCAHAQQTHHFNRKALAAQFDLPIYPTRGHVTNNEVIVTKNDVIHQLSAVYTFKGKLEKAVAYYTEAFGEPTHKVDDLGRETSVFKGKDKLSSKVRHRVMVRFDAGAHLVEVTLWKRTYQSAKDADN